MRLPTSRRGSRHSRLLEALESRTLLTTDLSGTFVTEPSAFLSGSRQTVALRVDNGGDTSARGTLAVAFYAALDGASFDPNTAVSLGRATASPTIAAGHSYVVTKTLTFSTAFDAGSYRLYAVITPGRPAEEPDTSNNTAISDVFFIAQPNYDLKPSFASNTFLPPAIIIGKQTSATARITITNPSDSLVNLPRSQRITVQVVARPQGASDSSHDVLLNTQLVSVSSIRPGRSTTVALRLTFPADLPAGAYDIIVNADTKDALAETDETNNSATFANTLLSAAPFVDPSLAFNSATTLPPSVVADGRLLPVKIDITNLGNINFPAGQTSSISIFAVSADASTHSFSTFTVNLAGIAPGKTRTFSLKPTVPTDLDLGSYTLEASLSTTASGDLLPNNNASVNQSLAVDPPYYNLATGIPSTNFTHALSNDVANSGTIVVPLQNLSNTLIPAGKNADVSLTLRSASSSSQDIYLGTFSRSIGGLGIGLTRKLSFNITIPAHAAVSDYVVVASVNPVGLAESTMTDNAATSVTVISVAAPFSDLAVASASTTFPTPSAIGTSALGTVVIRNTGNLSVTNSQGQVHIQFWGRALGGTFNYLLGDGNFTVNLSPGASSPPFNIALSLADIPNDGTVSSRLYVWAEIANPDDFDDHVSYNNKYSATQVVLAIQPVDLLVQTATNPFPASALASATATGQVRIINVSSGLSSGNVTVQYWASTSGTLDGSKILLGSNTAHISLLQTQISPTISVPLSLANLSAGATYHIIVQITATPSVDNNSNNNTMTLQNTVTILPPV